jgi:hypothetical protein
MDWPADVSSQNRPGWHLLDGRASTLTLSWGPRSTIRCAPPTKRRCEGSARCCPTACWSASTWAVGLDGTRGCSTPKPPECSGRAAVRLHADAGAERADDLGPLVSGVHRARAAPVQRGDPHRRTAQGSGRGPSPLDLLALPARRAGPSRARVEVEKTPSCRRWSAGQPGPADQDLAAVYPAAARSSRWPWSRAARPRTGSSSSASRSRPGSQPSRTQASAITPRR